MTTDGSITWVRYWDKLSIYQQTILVAGMLGAIEHLQQQTMTTDDIITYWDRILVAEQLEGFS